MNRAENKTNITVIYWRRRVSLTHTELDKIGVTLTVLAG